MDTTLDVRMARCGFRSAIIRAQTGLTRKQVASLRKRLGIVGPAESGPLPQAHSILSGKAKAMEASLFMLNYLYLAKTPRVDVDIDAVIAAHDQYFHCHAAIRNDQMDLDNFLDIDDAWVVARDYRALEVMMRSCSGCHIQFVSSIHDSRQCCPICNGAVVRTDLFSCDAQAVVTERSVPELIEISALVMQFKHWGCTETEICKEHGLNSDEYALCLALPKLTNAHLASITNRFATGVDLLSTFKQEGIGAMKASPAALAVA
ncbi:TPA: FlhC family transcriptional regulator [Pseudomonas aeruginosa]|uniref:FlhC family transcriptional regulator n=1 Tax=Pseudomonas aeruginosa TaxID=287 RepID=UPI0024B3C9F9|nr:FlhC family transcriptional regulator [Pseudomonas aeruginosa]MDS9914784.1 FlhC family transcriptional regulator [Pseudomonas aeruginosa]CAI9794735.1 Flagellar transcriptional activator FlhC [Pseudomonas aeruginosa]CAI9912124.1 Flagellar transcriptional activator FlhC [Pseudomonas aeruginosa]HBO1619780.1 hypothetical protein [Pseudomonas aeruginosa]HBO9386100.1 hypothetical protein [Pseudomonas aeruginosa]